MVADAWIFYNTFREYMADGTIDLDGDTFLMGLVTSAYTPDYENHSVLSDITNEVSGYGYARDTLSCTWVRSTTTVTFDSDDGVYTASGGSIVCRRAFIYDDTPSSPTDPLACLSLLDNTPADVTVTDGNSLTVEIHTSGIFTLTGGSS